MSSCHLCGSPLDPEGECLAGCDAVRSDKATVPAAPVGLREEDLLGRNIRDSQDTEPMETRTLPGYEIVGEIARGGMGVIYRAVQKNLERTVALKMLLAGKDANPDERERFIVEARAVARLRHPNIISIHDFGFHRDEIYFTMDIIEGQSLQERLKEGPLTVEKALGLMLDVLEGVRHAHDNGVIHRDLKPSNILIDREGRALITDFGVAKVEGQRMGLTSKGGVIGSLYYMSPEQASGNSGEVDERSDIFSLGVILYATLTRKVPFYDPKTKAVIDKIVLADPTRPSRLNPQVDPVLDAICLKALAKDRAKRYQSAKEMAEAIRGYLQREKAPPKRRSGLMILAGALLALLGMASGAAYFLMRPEALTFGVYRYLDAAEMDRIYLSLAESLSQELGRQVVPLYLDNASLLAQQTASGKMAVAVMPPVPYVELLTRSPGVVTAIARVRVDDQLSYGPILVANRALAEAHARRVGDNMSLTFEDVRRRVQGGDFGLLKGAPFAIVSRSSSSGFRMPYIFLAEHGVDMLSFFSLLPASMNTHNKVVSGLGRGEAALGATYDRFLAQARRKGIAPGVELLAETFPIPEDIVVVASSMDPVEVKALKGAIQKSYVSAEVTGSFSYHWDLQMFDEDLRFFKRYIDAAIVVSLMGQNRVRVDRGTSHGFTVGTRVRFFSFGEMIRNQVGAVVASEETDYGEGRVVESTAEASVCAVDQPVRFGLRVEPLR